MEKEICNNKLCYNQTDDRFDGCQFNDYPKRCPIYKKLKMSAQPEAERSHILMLDEVRELVDVYEGLDLVKDSLLKEKPIFIINFYNNLIDKINEKVESIKAHFV